MFATRLPIPNPTMNRFFAYGLFFTVLCVVKTWAQAPQSLTRGEQTLAKRCFVNKFSYATGQENWCLAVADFDKDNKLDIATASKSSDLLQVMYNDGTGEFDGYRSFHGPKQQRALCAVDANKDGWTDIIGITLLGQVSVFLNDKKGGFKKPILLETDRMGHSINAADMDNDGNVDLLVTAVNESSILIFRGNGDGTFILSPKAIHTGSKPRVVRVAEFNKDNRLDIVVGCDDGYVYVHLNDAKNEFARQNALRANADNWGLVVADFNHDNRPDIASASYQERTLCVHLNKHDTVFVRSQSVISGEHNFDVAADDFDRDGDVDVITCSANDELINLHLNNGDGTLDSRIAIPSGRWNSSMIAADIDDDGDADIITASIIDKSINIHRNIASELKPTRTVLAGIQGTVFNKDINEVIAYQPITIVDKYGNTVKTTMTNHEGKYVVNVVGGEYYTMRIRHNSLPPYREVVFVAPDSMVKHEVVLSRNMGATIAGKIINLRTGEAVTQAHIQVHDADDNIIARISSDQAGTFRQYIPYGLGYKITIAHPEYRGTSQEVDVAAAEGGQVMDMSFALEPDVSTGKLMGSVTDAMLGTPLPETFVVVRNMAGEEITSFSSDESGRYTVALMQGAYQMLIYKKGYFYSRHFIDMRSYQLGRVQEINLVLPRIRAGTNIILNELTYDKSDYTIRNLPKETLESLLKIMQDNPSLVAEIAGHTDNDGSEQANLELSQRRADNIAEYLTDHGVPSRRIKARGYGESMPIADNTSEDGKQQNRRIEFKIIAY